jgi:hypothetical protein
MARIPEEIEIRLKVKFSLWEAIKVRIAGGKALSFYEKEKSICANCGAIHNCICK